MLPRLFCTIDDRAVDVADCSWESVFGGYGAASGQLPATQAHRVGQGDMLKIYTDDGAKRYEGRLARPPTPHHGTAEIVANGHRLLAEKRQGRLLYLSRDVGQWFLRSGPPTNFGESQVVGVGIEADRVLFTEAQGAPANNPNFVSVCFWARGSPGGINRLAFTHQGTATGSRQYEIYTTDGFPADGPYTVLSPVVGESSTPVDRDWASVPNMGTSGILLQRKYVGGASTYAEGYAMVYNLRVGGIALTDEFLTSLVVADIGKRMSYDSGGVKPSITDAMPFDHLSGSWAQALDYMAFLDDWQWRVTVDRGAGPYLEYTPWEREWDVLVARDAVPELVALEFVNQVRVEFQRVGDIPDEIVITPEEIGMANPLPEDVVEEVTVILDDVQADDKLARSVGQAHLRRGLTPRFQGRINITGARREGGVDDPFGPLVGDLSRVGDWGPAEAQSLRIHNVSYSQQGVVLGVDGALATTFGEVELARLRHRGPTPELPIPEPGEWIDPRSAWLARMEHLGVGSMAELAKFGKKKAGKKKAGGARKAGGGERKAGGRRGR